VIQLIDQALEQYLRAAVPLPEKSVDVSFVTPDKTWGKSITQPSVNLFLWDVKRSAPRSQTGRVEQTIEEQRYRRAPLPVIDLNYFVTAWASEHRDEHQLLGAVMTTILATREVPAEYVPEQFAGLAPMTVELATSESRKPGDFVSVLDGQLKPGLEVRVSLEVDALQWLETGPPTEVIEIGVARDARDDPARMPAIEDRPRPVRRRRQGSVVMEGKREPAGPTP
jgi:Pvc16 N-terminal domain